MNTPQERLQADMKTAMKAKDKERLSTVRMLLTAVKNEAIRIGGDVDEDGFVRLVQKSVKQREDASQQYRDGGREELAAKEDREAVILAEYLPEQASEDDIRQAVQKLVDDQGLEGPRAIGVIMKEMMAHFGSSAEGRVINKIAREVLG